jgi:uncharacterized protein (TIGR02757 family)
MNSPFPTALKLALDQTIKEYQHKEFLKTDPIHFATEYKDPLDQELISLISCLYAYGNVKSINKFLSSIFKNLGPNPYLSFATKDKHFTNAKKNINLYRFQTKKDNEIIMDALSEIARVHFHKRSKYSLFEDSFLNAQGQFDALIGIALFQQELETKTMLVSKGNALTRGLRFLIGDSKAKSAKKRYCLFLRWMVRSGFPDFGIYSRIKASEIPFPLDVHIQRLIRILGISDKKTLGIKEGLLVKDYFSQLNPEDPLLYDFFLTRVGMIQKCQGKKIESICSKCSLKTVCLIGSATGN